MEGSLLVRVMNTALLDGADKLIANTASPPGFKLRGDKMMDGPPAGRIVVMSAAVLLAAPPPDTVAMLVTLAGALPVTFTVAVMGG